MKGTHTVFQRIVRGGAAFILASTLSVPAAALAETPATANGQAATAAASQTEQSASTDNGEASSQGSESPESADDFGITAGKAYTARITWTGADGLESSASLSQDFQNQVTLSRTDDGAYAIDITTSTSGDAQIGGLKDADGSDAQVVSASGATVKTYRIVVDRIDGLVELSVYVERTQTWEPAWLKINRLTILEKQLMQPLYRLYNPYTGEHFYTKDASERDDLAKVGWRDEGIGWYAPVVVGLPVYRMYNPYAGEHHYTTSATERDMLVRAGWNFEGIGWHSAPDWMLDRVPLLRDYNPNQFAWNHNYTINVNEHNYLDSIGWRDEGIGWYGLERF